MTDKERGHQDGYGDALLRVKRVSYGPWQNSPDYAEGYKAGQRAGLAERVNFDKVLRNPPLKGGDK